MQNNPEKQDGDTSVSSERVQSGQLSSERLPSGQTSKAQLPDEQVRSEQASKAPSSPVPSGQTSQAPSSPVPSGQTSQAQLPDEQVRSEQASKAPSSQVPSGQTSQAQVATTQLPTARLVDASMACVNDAGGAAPGGWRLAMTLFFGGLLRPKRAASNTSHIPLSAAFAIHAGFICLIAAVVLTMLTWEIRYSGTEAIRSQVQAILLFQCGLLDANTFMDALGEHCIFWCLGACAVELSVVAFAFVLSSWGAREEPLRVTLANSLRQTWLHAPSVFYVLLALKALLDAIRWNSQWVMRNPSEAIRYALTDNVGFRDTWCWLARTWDSISDGVSVPRLEASRIVLGLALLALALGWLFATLLARIGARPVQKTSGHPPRCENCGYILYGIDVDGRCPECGVSVRNAIGPDARPGVPWQSTLGLPRVIAWFSTAWDQLRRPASFGKRIKRIPGNLRHRTFALISVLLVAVCACVGVLYYIHTVHVFNWKQECPLLDAQPLNSLQLTFFSLVSLTLASIVAMIVLTACASIVGGWHRLRHGENTTAAAMQPACYTSWLLAFAFPLPFVVAAGIVAQSPLLARIAEFCSVAVADHGIAFMVTPVVVILLLRTFIVARTTKAMRYANR